MAVYVDGFVIPVPKKAVAEYMRISRRAGRVWKDLGALEYRECVADDVSVKFGLPFTKLAKAKPTETVVFSWIVYKSRRHRDRVNAQVMKDPRMAKMMSSPMPFDTKRMSYGGFACKVDL
jgi:uncharacterized protein YbaA (DUF1428 family)